MAIVRAIGQPETNSERKAIQYFKQHLPDATYTIFHNLELSTPSGFPYEYDLLVVGEYAVYHVEVKGYQGAIRGNAYQWEFESSAIIASPIPLANKKSRVVASLLRRNTALQQVFVQTLVVLTDDRVRIRLNDPLADQVLHLDEAVDYMLDPRRLPIRANSIVHLKDQVSSAIASQFQPLQKRHEIGEYRVVDTIGNNELYTTLLAEHRLLRHKDRFTLKVYNFDIYASDGTKQRQREWLLRDAEALHRLAGHPNIVQAYAPFVWEHNKIVLPVEWTDGYSLRGLLEDSTSIKFTRKADIIRQVCEGLQHAHQHHVVHRNMRPDDIIVPYEGPVKLVNFDCARFEDSDFQTIGTLVGRQLSQCYVAPEVWYDTSAVSPVSDMYAVGIIFFELLTGRVPYERIQKLFEARGLPVLPTQLEPTLPSDVDEIIARMCAFEPADRYTSLQEVIEDLQIIG